jgi:hypothetical protein
MPTTNPRVNVTLSPSTDLLVQRFAAHQRVSKSQVLRELLEAAEPALERAVMLMEAAASASAGLRAKVSGTMQRGQEAAEDAFAVILSRVDRMTRDLVSEAEEVQGKRPGRQEGPRARGEMPAATLAKRETPAASNRGVKSAKGGAHRATKSRVATGRRGSKK